jgi:adenylate cyclase
MTGAAEPGRGGSTAQRFEELVLGGPPRYTRGEISRQAGVSVATARRFWRAMGFPNTGSAAKAFTDADLAALSGMVALVRHGSFDDEFAVSLTRSLGQTMARLAEWQVQALFEYLTEERGLNRDDAVRAAVQFAADHLAELEDLLVYAWRRQLAAVADRALVPADPEVEPGLRSVGFADLVSYTRLSQRLEERELGRLVLRFESRSNDVIAANHGRLVKSVGDEVLFVADEVEQAAEIALGLAETMAADSLLPDVRVGLARGNVVARLGDVFGTTVNLASRLTDDAAPGSVLCDERTADSLDGHPAYAIERKPPRMIRGIGQVSPGVLRRCSRKGADRLPRSPVTGPLPADSLPPCKRPSRR